MSPDFRYVSPAVEVGSCNETPDWNSSRGLDTVVRIESRLRAKFTYWRGSIHS